MIPVIDPGDSAIFQIDWSDAIAEGVSLTSVTHLFPSPLVKITENVIGLSSYAKVSGAQHGMLYLVQAEAVLSSGETLNRNYPLRCGSM